MNLVTILKRSNNLPVATDSHTLSFNSWKSAIIHGKKSKNMINETLEPIIMYKSTTCPHSWSVERWLKSKNINTTFINIDKEPGARAVVQSLNNGYASVPTLIFPDGTQAYFARDWFYSYALCDFDFDGIYWAFTTAQYTSEVKMGSDSSGTYFENE